MTPEQRIHELTAQVADLAETVATLTEQIKALQAEERTEPALPPQVYVAAPVVQVSVPPAPPAPAPRVPDVNVTLPPPPNCVISHEWGMDKGHFVPVRSYVTRTPHG